MITLPPRAGALAVFLFGCGLAYYAVTSLQEYVSAVEAASITEVPLTERHVFARDLPRHHVVTPQDLELRAFASATAPATDDVTGRRLVADVTAGTPAIPSLTTEAPRTITVRRGSTIERIEIQ